VENQTTTQEPIISIPRPNNEELVWEVSKYIFQTIKFLYKFLFQEVDLPPLRGNQSKKL